MNPSIREALTHGAARLQTAGIESARLDARILLSRALGISADDLFSAEITAAEVATFESLIRRRAAREPLAYITGGKEFWSLEFEVGPGVLVPRPESETLIEEALRRFPAAEATLRVLDIGAGSGCLLTAFLKERVRATGLGLDISEDALAYARRNAERHGQSGRCSFEKMRSSPEYLGATRNFDVILANPPYLTNEEFAASPQEIRDYEPRDAFVAGPDGLAAFRVFLPIVAESLSPAGSAFLEIGASQANRASKIVTNAGLEIRGSVPDLSGTPRCLVIGRAGAGSLWRP